MRYHALACDFDGTIAWDGRVSENTIKALEAVRNSGRKLILVTGRELPDLIHTFPELYLFDRVVVENGALLYRPSTREEKVLAEAPPPEFAEELRLRGVERVSVGRVIVATWTPHETTVLQVIKEMGLELQVIFNKGAVMVLPSGVNKATGLAVALEELSLSAHNVVGVGDAENDHAFLSTCECSVAVANALDTLKGRVDWVTPEGHGEGVVQLIEALSTDLVDLESRLRQSIRLGHRSDGSDFAIKPYPANILITGSSGSGKSTIATSFIEALVDQAYQFVIVDPEGDYSTLEKAVVLGDEQRAPNVQEVMELVEKPLENVGVNLVGLALKERPDFFRALFPRIHELRAKTGRPHWLIVDEAHHVLPSQLESAGLTLSQRVYGMVLITLEAHRVAPAILSMMDLVIGIGDEPDDMLRIFAGAVGREGPPPTRTKLRKGEALVWSWRSDEEPYWIRTVEPRAERRRHRRKYAEGELPPEQSFYFRGPEDKLNLRAQNLTIFLQIAEGVDDETWMFHLKSGDVSRWFRDVIKDSDLAKQAEQYEKEQDNDPLETRSHLKAEIENRYILAA